MLARQGAFGSYVVAWGAIFFGAFLFLKGAGQSSS
jgi:hypothetical protein